MKRDRDFKREKINGVNIVRVNQYRYRGQDPKQYIFSYLKFFMRCFILVTIRFLKNKYQIIHVNNMPDFLVFCAIVPKLLGAKLILDIHDPMALLFLTKFNLSKNNYKYKFILYQEKLSSRFADRVITVHEPLKKDVLINEGIPQRKITVLTNFADDILFRPSENYTVNLPIKILYHGTIAVRFGLINVVKAISTLKDKESIYFKIIGEGDSELQLKKTIEELDLAHIINFENKFYSITELPDIIKDFHLGLISYIKSPATDYMLPVKMLEYVALGIPVITVPNIAIQYYFNNGECWFYDSDNFSSLTNLLEKLIRNPKILLERRNKIMAIRHKYNWSHEKIHYSNLLDNLIKRNLH